MSENKRISLFYSKKQWVQIEFLAKKTGRKSTQHYIISQIAELDKIVNECEDCFNNERITERRVYSLPEISRTMLEDLSKKTGLPPSTIISRFIINPLFISNERT